MLVDIGISNTSLTNKLISINVDIKDIKYLFITHTHKDHIQGLEVFLKRYNPIIISSKKIIKELIISHNISNYLVLEDMLTLNNIDITLLQASHDTIDCIGFLLEYKDNSMVYITDTGYIHNKTLRKIENKEHYFIESNYDINKLMNGTYPHYLKMRILSDKGHLDNLETARYLKKVIGPNTKNITLLHLSEENNCPSIAYENIISMLEKTEYSPVVTIALQHEVSKGIKL